jgi:hypothetical protein
MYNLSFGTIDGLTDAEQSKLADLLDVYRYHSSNNAVKEKYYNGHISINDVNLGIAIPEGLRNIQVGCEWGAKTVDVLASRSMFDGFVAENGEDPELLSSIVDANNLLAQYMQACKDELKYGCTFATLSRDDKDGCRIRFHSPLTAAALWDGSAGRIDCGFAIIDTEPDDRKQVWTPSIVNYYTPDAIIVLTRNGSIWEAERYPHSMGRPLMEPLIYNATSNKPFGRSRLKRPIRALIDGYVRTIINATIALEFDTTPQKYILGVTDDQYDAIISSKFKQYIGSIIAATQNPETGENPVFGQLSQGSLEPHVSMLRVLATQFSAATGLTVTDTGVVNDSNPTSSDAILAQSQTLVLLAEQLNQSNGDHLKTIAQMAQAIALNTDINGLSDEQKNVIAHFKNPAMPSVAMTADAATKIASSRSDFASTDVYLEMVGFDQADIRRIKAQEQRSRGLKLIEDMQNETTTEEQPAEGETEA